ncbi:MAG: hypothetical protein K8L99_16845 [Anaerolineae bacterium]|nr:hypothetical protein [Anaerolineae bacterium]
MNRKTLLLAVTLLMIWQPVVGQMQPPATPREPYSLIAFTSDRDKYPEIYVMNPDGSDPINLTHNDWSDTVPRWVSDQRMLTFSAVREEHPQAKLPYIMNLDGTQSEPFGAITYLLDNYFLDVTTIFPSNDGRQVAFVSERAGDSEIYIMDWDDPDPLNITRNPAHDSSPDWSPDDTQIVFQSDRSENYEIYVVDVQVNAEPVNLTNTDTPEFAPTWSPDGQKIAFGTSRDGNPEIYVMDADGSDVRNLTNHPGGDWNPDWSPDGKFIVFFTDRDGNDEVYIMDADGTNQTNLTNNPADDFFPSWSPWLTVDRPSLTHSDTEKSG